MRSIPVEVAAPVAAALLAAVGLLWRMVVSRAAACDQRVTALEKRVDELQEKRVGDLAAMAGATREAIDRAADAIAGLRESSHRWFDRVGRKLGVD